MIEYMNYGKNMSLIEISMIILPGLIYMMLVTKQWKNELILMGSLVSTSVCLIFMKMQLVSLAVICMTATSIVLVVYAIFWKKRKCKGETNNEQNPKISK